MSFFNEIEPNTKEILNKLNLTECRTYSFLSIKNLEAFLRTFVFSKYKRVAFILNEKRREDGRVFAELGKKYGVSTLVFLSAKVPYDFFSSLWGALKRL